MYVAHFRRFHMKMEMAIASFSLLRYISVFYSSSKMCWVCWASLCKVRLELFGLPGENRTLVVPVSEKAEVEGKCLEGNSEVSSLSRLLMLTDGWAGTNFCWCFPERGCVMMFNIIIFQKLYSKLQNLVCSQVRFVWHDRHSEEENLINLVIERNTEMPNLVYLRWAPPGRTFLIIFLSSGAFLRLHHHNRRLEFYTPMGSLENRTLLWPIRCLLLSILKTV